MNMKKRLTLSYFACNNNNGSENPSVTPLEGSEVNVDNDFTFI